MTSLARRDRARAERQGSRWIAWALGLLAAVWMLGGLYGAFTYLNEYLQHRGFAVLHRAPGVAPGRSEWIHFYSAALHREADYLVYLPSGYTGRSHYPVFYLLHGMPGRPQAFIRIGSMDVLIDDLTAAHGIPPMIYVFPDGRIGGDTLSDSEWANTSSGDFESYLLEVVHNVDRHFPAIPRRDARVIGGYSAGAYGAINIAIHHPDLFGAVQIWSGYFKQSQSGVFSHASAEQLLYNSPLEWTPYAASELRRHPLNVFMFTGRGDHDHIYLAPMAAELEQAGAHVTARIYPGGHDWGLWHGRLQQLLILAGRAVARSIPRFHAERVGTINAHWHPRHRYCYRHPLSPPALRACKRRVAAQRRFLKQQRLATERRLAKQRRLSGGHRGHRHAFAGRTRRHRRHRHGSTPRAGAAAAGGSSGPAAAAAAAPGSTHPRRHGTLGLLVGLALALLSAAAINLGFLLQHRGLRRAGPSGGPWHTVKTLLRTRQWVAGQAIGLGGWAVQLAAVAIAPLSLVQAFAAGGLALSVPMAARLFVHPVSRRTAGSIALVSAALIALALGLRGGHDHLVAIRLAVVLVVAAIAGCVLALQRLPALKAMAAGLFYGVADSAIKAIAVRWSGHGVAALVSGWGAVALLATFAGFLAFQAALRVGAAVSGISLMTVFATLVSVVSGLSAFGEVLGRGAAWTAVHAVAIALILACVPVLAAAQSELSEQPSDGAGDRAPDREHGALDPWAGGRRAREHDVAHRDVPRHGVGLLGEEQKDQQPNPAR